MKYLMHMVLICIALVFCSACSRQINLKIGVAVPLTGSLAPYGRDIVQGAQIAVDEINSQRFLIDGRPAHVELVIEDDKASIEHGQAAAQRLIDAGVVAVWGHFNSSVTIAAAPLYASAGIPQLSSSTNPKYTRMGWKTAFRITADDIQQGIALGHVISEKLNSKSIFLVDDASTFGAGIADEVISVLRSKNIQLRRESVDAEVPFYAGLAQKISESKADTVFFGGDERRGIPLLQILRRMGSTVRFVAADGMCDMMALKAAEGAADNNFFCTAVGVPPSWLSSGIGFVQRYKARYGEPGAFSSFSYDGVHIMLQAMQRAYSIQPRNYSPLLKQGSFDGKIQGPIEFDHKGDVRDATVVHYEAIAGRLREMQ